MMSGYHCKGDENCAFLGCYPANSVDFLLTFQEDLLVPSLGCDAVSLGKFVLIF